MGIAYLGELLSIEQFRQLVYETDLGIYNKVYVHHTAVPTEAQWGGKAMLDNIYRIYESRGWPVGPNLFIAPEGIWHCTPVWMDGIASGDNYQARQIETVGNYNDHLPSGATLDNVVAATGILLQKPTPLGVDAIWQHRWAMNTDCPGDMWSANWGWFRGLVQQYMDTHPLDGSAQPPAPPPVVDVVENVLRNEAWACAGVVYNPDAAFAKYARERQLGSPVTGEFDMTVDGVSYRAQGFQGGIVYAIVGDWQNCLHFPW